MAGGRQKKHAVSGELGGTLHRWGAGVGALGKKGRRGGEPGWKHRSGLDHEGPASPWRVAFTLGAMGGGVQGFSKFD